MKGLTHNRSIFITFCFLFLLFGACRRHETRRVIFFRDLQKAPPFVATVDGLEFFKAPDERMSSTNGSSNLVDVCIIGIRTATGEKFCLGSPDFEAKATAEFGRTLEIGKSYEFPKIWLEFDTNDKHH
jgi:hypothetical protein